MPNSPAAKAGFTKGDLIFTVEGKIVTNVGALRSLVSKAAGRKRLRMTLFKGGREHKLVVPLDHIPKGTSLSEDGF